MPELPEVESIKLKLENYLIGHTIKKVQINHQKSFQGEEKNLMDGKVVSVRRFGKVLVLDLSNGCSLIIHLKMSGQLIYRGPNLKNPPNFSKKVLGGVPGKHTHVIFYLDKRGVLYFNDVRKFGWIRVVETNDVTKGSFIGELGPEPLKDLNLEKFIEILARSSKPIKLLLMDQKKIAGIGNIYANDALWLAKINPRTPADKLTKKSGELLFKSMNKVLKDAIKLGGASETYYVTPEGSEGKYQNSSLVYDRGDEICTRCKKANIKKIFLGGRGTYFCPACQKN
jgi:formamidopyrimidine-DNA glycosylase